MWLCSNDQSMKGALGYMFGWEPDGWLLMVADGCRWLPMVADGSREDINYCFQEVQDSEIDAGAAINYKIKWHLLSAAGSLRRASSNQ